MPAWLTSIADPFRMEPVEIGGIVRIKHTLAFRRERQLFVIGPPAQPGFQCREHCHAPGAKRVYESPVRRILIDIDLDRSADD